jgi:transcriptional regulator with XRE-family HTH domain
MIIGDRLRILREDKKLSQGDIEQRSGLLRAYVSRVENGYTISAVETLEKFARALEVPMYQLLYDGEEPPNIPNHANRKSGNENLGEQRQRRTLAQQLPSPLRPHGE